MAYIGKSPTGTGVRQRYYFTATGGETSLSGADDNGLTLSYSDGAYVDVLLNGIELVAGTDYNTSTANTIAGLAALAASDVVTVTVYDIFTVADTVSASNGGTFSGNVVFNGNTTGLDLNGTDLILDADADSKIEASTDDTINIISGGTTGFTMNSAGVILQPTKPMFDVRGVAGQSITSALFTKVQFNNEQFDIGGYYDPTTNYRYTPLVAGKYFIYGRVYITYGSSAVTTTIVSIYKNGSEYTRYQRNGYVIDSGSVEVSAIIDFNGTTDYVEIYAYQTASSDALIYTSDPYGAFFGYLIG